jgi:hypothetical protein
MSSLSHPDAVGKDLTENRGAERCMWPTPISRHHGLGASLTGAPPLGRSRL